MILSRAANECLLGIFLRLFAGIRRIALRLNSCRIDKSLADDVGNHRSAGRDDRRDLFDSQVRHTESDKHGCHERNDRRPKLAAGQLLFPVNLVHSFLLPFFAVLEGFSFLSNFSANSKISKILVSCSCAPFHVLSCFRRVTGHHVLTILRFVLICV